MSDSDRFERWITALEARQLSELTFQEVARALRALSATYVERRGRLAEGAALSGAGKRAAFALFYAPLHFMLTREIVAALGIEPRGHTIVDLGCGTGVAGAAWGTSSATRQPIAAIDRHSWALAEAAWTFRQLDLNARTIRADMADAKLPKSPASIVAAFAFNELAPAVRDGLLERLIARTRSGDRLLIVEPLARGAAPWWPAAELAVKSAGGRADEWRFPSDLPAIVAKLDRAAGLDHRELTGRSLFVEGRDRR